MVMLTNLMVGLVGTAAPVITGPMQSFSTLSGETPLVSLAASSNSFCSLACLFLEKKELQILNIIKT